MAQDVMQSVQKKAGKRNSQFMGKDLFIAEKPSVAKEFAKVLGVSGNAGNGYLESGDSVVTWCVGHLVTMSYPDAYDPALKKWSLQTLPFLPEKFLYELIPDVKKQFQIDSPFFLTQTVIGSMAPPQSAARSPGSRSKCWLERQYGQWFRCSLPAPLATTVRPQTLQTNESVHGCVL